MIQLIIPNSIQTKLFECLVMAGDCETGGILMGTIESKYSIRVTHITANEHLGTPTTFIRVADAPQSELDKFFEYTDYQYARYNYIGEWHSHPGMTLIRSLKDHLTMLEMLGDPVLGANFLVLLIVTSNLSTSRLIASATLYNKPETTHLLKIIWETEK